MKNEFLPLRIALVGLLTLFGTLAMAQTTISGKVLDAESGEGLLGAHIILKSTTAGATSDANGEFTLVVDNAAPFVIVISYLGYESQEFEITGNQSNLRVELSPDFTANSEVVVSASRQPEKIQEAPAAISIIKSTQLVGDAVGNPFLSLRNMVGVDVGQAGVNSGFITLRGSSSVFQTETFVIADYRNLVLPGLGTLGYGQQPIDAIDLDRVEVIKGPGSALYGPGVEAGIVHFLSKSPIEYPGTTVSVGGGTQSAFESAVRHAGTNKDKTFGYKIFTYYKTAKDWELDPNDPVDSQHLATYQPQIVSNLDGSTVFTEVPDYLTESYGFTGTLEFLPSDNTKITSTGGWSVGKYIFRTAQGEGYTKTPRPFAQIRVQSGGLFAQAFWSYFNGEDGKTGLYPTGLTSINKAQQLEGQVQYNFQAADDKLDITTGADYRLNVVDTDGTVHGRNEENDDFSIYGVYVQTDLDVTNKLSFIAAGRVDRFGALEATSFSPRVGLVYNANPKHTFRATYNHAVGTPTSINLYADLPLANSGAFLAYLLGGAGPISFDDMNTTSFLPGNAVFDGVGADLAPVYAVLTAGITSSGSLPQALTDYLATLTPSIVGSSAGVLSQAPRSRGPLELSKSDMFEVGYKGTINNTLSITLDAYYNIRQNIISAPQQASPLVVQPTLAADLAAAIEAVVDPDVVDDFGLTPAAVAAIYQGAALGITGDATNGFSPLGVIESDQTNPDAALPTLDLAYYNIRKIEYFGIDFGAQYNFTRDIYATGSLSWISDNVFRDVPVGEGDDAPTTDFSLNVPSTKVKLGLGYQPEFGFNATLDVRYQNEWDAINGTPFTGPVDAYTIVDLGAGYRFRQGITANVTATNLFEEEYRFIYGAPKIGRQILGRITYTFGDK